MELSEEALRVFGSAPDDRLSFRDLLRMMTREERHGLIRGMRQIVRQVFGIAMDVPLSRGVKRNRIIHVEGEPEFGEYGQCVGYTGIVQDVTERHQAEDSIRKLANKDPLTQLPNRRQFNWRAERALEQARRMGHKMALLLIDLDRFKNINDTLGHAAGDELLLEVSMRLRGCVRHSDQIFDGTVEAVGSRFHRALEAVGRLGGDEFVALLPEVEDERDAERVAQRILEALRQPVYVADQEFFATASVGIALYPRTARPWPTCCATPTWRCTPPRTAAATARCSTRPIWRCATARSWSSRRRCTRPSSATNWCCTTSPRWTPRAAA
jgi:GGDEF domain-containing protein